MVTSRVFLKKSVLQWATLVHGGGTSTGYAANALRGLFLLERVSQSFTSTKSKSKRYGFPFIWLVDVIRPVNWIQQNKITLPHLKFFTTLELIFCLISLKSRVGYQKKKKRKNQGAGSEPSRWKAWPPGVLEEQVAVHGHRNCSALFSLTFRAWYTQ